MNFQSGDHGQTQTDESEGQSHGETRYVQQRGEGEVEKDRYRTRRQEEDDDTIQSRTDQSDLKQRCRSIFHFGLFCLFHLPGRSVGRSDDDRGRCHFFKVLISLATAATADAINTMTQESPYHPTGGRPTRLFSIDS